jgi:arylsulfatase A-like enzyme
LVANIDLAPTFCELAGVPAPDSIDGTSLVGLLDDPESEWRDALLIEHWPTEEGIGSLIPAFTAVRTDRWKYVAYSTGERELYSLQSDPDELRNLANDLRYGELMRRLASRLGELEQE